MEIRNVGVVGLGALGVLFTKQFTDALGKNRVFVIADRERVDRYRSQGVYYNGKLCDFNYVSQEDGPRSIDLIIVSVKFGGLSAAIDEMRPWVGENTLILSAVNGISSESYLREAFGRNRVIDCVAERMSAVKEGNRVAVGGLGQLAFGEKRGEKTERVMRVARFFDSIGFTYELPPDMEHHMWAKLLCNTGLNQVCMVYEGGYALVQQPGAPRQLMISVMEEVVDVANAHGVGLSRKDIDMWLGFISKLKPESEPSMRQDGKAKRPSEVELFSGTICRMGREKGISTPLNNALYTRIKEIEGNY